MDRKSHEQEIERLTRLGTAARFGLSHGIVSLRQRLDVQTRVRSSLQGHPLRWTLGSLAAGLVLSMLLRRPTPARQAPVPAKKRGLPLTLLGLTLTAVRPFAKIWLADQVKQHLAGQSPSSKGRRPRSPSFI